MSNNRSWAISILATFILLSAIGGGFWLGHHRAFFKIRKVVPELNRPTSVYYYTAREYPTILDDPNIRARYASLYELPTNSNRDVIEHTLKNAGWHPAMAPKPFLGIQPQPSPVKLFKINSYGFRDSKNNYLPKPSSVIRVFLTGGSVAFGAGAKSGDETISGYLEKRLNSLYSSQTGFTYEVVNAGVPAWTTTHERILIENKLIDLQPDYIIMISGTDDAHWALLETEDIMDFWTYIDRDFMLVMNNAYNGLRFPPAVPFLDLQSETPSCQRVARVAHRNVSLATHASNIAGIDLAFVLMPTLYSTKKTLTQTEAKHVETFGKGVVVEKPIWDACYEAIRHDLSFIGSENYKFLDFSRAFSSLGAKAEVFIDTYHFANAGNRKIAELLEKKIDWLSLRPNKSQP